VLALEDSKKRKPSKRPFKKAIRILDLKPSEILFVGDAPDKDIKGAKQAGMVTALAKYGQFLKGKTKADYELGDISDLVMILK
jgi:putative hydrolase of the HAD superfamily